MPKSPTLREIAKRAGVSVSTVSRVLNDQPGIGSETRAKVLSVAQELQFVPNVAAQTLATNRTRNIGLIGYKQTLPAYFTHSFSLFTIGVDQECQHRGYHFLTTLVDDEAMKDPFQLAMIREKRVDGLILSGPALKSSFILKLCNSDLPLVLFDNALQEIECDCVLHKNQENVYRLTQHLIREHQHQTIVFLSGPETWLSSRERAAGYRRALAEASLEPYIFYMPDTTVETGIEAMVVALAEVPHLTAVVAVNDAVAIGAARTCKNAGHDIPEKVAVVGFDDIRWAELHDPPLTTVHAYGEEMGIQVVRRLIELIESEPDHEHVHLRLRVGTKIVIRRSCGCQA